MMQSIIEFLNSPIREIETGEFLVVSVILLVIGYMFRMLKEK